MLYQLVKTQTNRYLATEMNGEDDLPTIWGGSTLSESASSIERLHGSETAQSSSKDLSHPAHVVAACTSQIPPSFAPNFTSASISLPCDNFIEASHAVQPVTSAVRKKSNVLFVDQPSGASSVVDSFQPVAPSNPPTADDPGRARHNATNLGSLSADFHLTSPSSDLHLASLSSELNSDRGEHNIAVPIMLPWYEWQHAQLSSNRQTSVLPQTDCSPNLPDTKTNRSSDSSPINTSTLKATIPANFSYNFPLSQRRVGLDKNPAPYGPNFELLAERVSEANFEPYTCLLSAPSTASTMSLEYNVKTGECKHADQAQSKEGRNPYQRRPYRHEAFPQKLYKLLVETESNGQDHIVSFTPSGLAFRVHDPKAFATDIIPRYFRHAQYHSFQRQLNKYGFERIHCGPDIGAYQHPLFQKGRPDLHRELHREYDDKVRARALLAQQRDSSASQKGDRKTVPPTS